MLTSWVPFFLRSGFAHVDNVITKRCQNNHTAAPVKVARQQTTLELSGTFPTLPPEPTPLELSGTLRNLPPEPAPASRTGTHRNIPEHIWAEDPISLCCWGKMIHPWFSDNIDLWSWSILKGTSAGSRSEGEQSWCDEENWGHPISQVGEQTLKTRLFECCRIKRTKRHKKIFWSFVCFW